MGGASDASAVEQLVPAARKVEVEDARVFHEEWAALVEERLECRQVDDRRVRLDLPEVGVDRSVQRECRPEAVAQIHSETTTGGGAVEKRITIDGGTIVQVAHDVRQCLETPRRARDVHAFHTPHLTDHAPLQPRHQRVVRLLVVRDARAKEIHAPGLLVVGRLVANLGEWNAKLHGPPLGVDVHR